MTTLTINVPDTVTEELTKVIKSFGGEIIRIKETTRDTTPIEELEQGLNEVMDIRDGRLPKLSLKQALRD
jgi:cysteine synthase